MRRRRFFANVVTGAVALLLGKRAVLPTEGPVRIANPYVIFTDERSMALVEHFRELHPNIDTVRLCALCYMSDLKAREYLGHPLSQFEYVRGF